MTEWKRCFQGLSSDRNFNTGAESSRRAMSTLLLALACAFRPAAEAEAVTIDWVTVGDPGNVADTTGYGAVAESFRIMKFEWTNSQYVQFLNAVDPTGINPYWIYNGGMDSFVQGGIIFTSDAPDGGKYTVKINMGDKPVNCVSWFDAARVANWLQNGQGSGSTETGAYTLNGAIDGDAPARNPGAAFYIPTEDQWYKAAYYKGGGTVAGYWYFPTGEPGPLPVSADATGIGSAGNTGNFANYANGADWNDQAGNVTTVGSNGGPSTYGTFDMGGNVHEWNDFTGLVAGPARGTRGGDFGGDGGWLTIWDRQSLDPTFEHPGYGFRLASTIPTAVPEIDPAGMGSVLALITGVLGILERRRTRQG